MFDTRNELLNLISLGMMTTVFLDPDGTYNTADQLNGNNLYMGFDVTSTPATGGFTAFASIYDDEED